MSELNFRSIASGYDVKYLLPVSTNKFWQANVCISSDHYQSSC